MGKIKNPYPNVDAHSGACLQHFGMVEYRYYTVVFAVSRAIGCLTNGVWSRAFGLPIERPNSVDMAWIREHAGKEAPNKAPSTDDCYSNDRFKLANLSIKNILIVEIMFIRTNRLFKLFLPLASLWI
jgi:hypothetical protein